jgi:hypothetical protein
VNNNRLDTSRLIIVILFFILAGILAWTGPSLTYPSFLIRWSFAAKNAFFASLAGLVFGVAQVAATRSIKTVKLDKWHVVDQVLYVFSWSIAFISSHLIASSLFSEPPSGGMLIRILALVLQLQFLAIVVALVSGFSTYFLLPFESRPATIRSYLFLLLGFFTSGAVTTLVILVSTFTLPNPFFTLPISFDSISIPWLLGGATFTMSAGLFLIWWQRNLRAA